jgi:DNA (cytosine-5)-methyltransferase 1
VTYLSVCSGIEAASVAWGPLGWTPWAFAEVDQFPSAVLAHHYPGVPNLGDMTRFEEWPDADVDVLVGGTPCQSFSVAGLRAGLDDPRGGLLLTYLAVARRYRPRWVVWENVPGVLSADDGRAFGSLLGGLAELGYGFAYRVLDARHFGLAQRRKRVFVVGHLGDWRRAAAVLFERASLSGHPAPRREAGEDVAGTLGGSSQSGGFRTTDLDNSGAFIPEIAPTLLAGGNRTGGDRPPGANVDTCESLIPSFIAFDTNPDNRCNPLAAGAHPPAVAFDARQSNVITYGDKSGPLDTDGWSIGVLSFSAKDYGGDTGDVAGALNAQSGRTGKGDAAPHVAHRMTVRRLTPRECERLQGFPDDYTLIPYRGKPAADGPRYKALGNSMAVPVMAWIGRRIQMVDDIA